MMTQQYFIKTETEGPDQGCCTAVICKFDVLVNNSVVAEAMTPILPPYEEDIDSMPFIKLHLFQCNCTLFPILGDIIIANSNESNLNFERDSDKQSIIQANSTIGKPLEQTNSVESSDEEIQKFSETFDLKGSTFHKEFQFALHKCKQKLIHNVSVELELFSEPVKLWGFTLPPLSNHTNLNINHFITIFSLYVSNTFCSLNSFIYSKSHRSKATTPVRGQIHNTLPHMHSIRLDAYVLTVRAIVMQLS